MHLLKRMAFLAAGLGVCLMLPGPRIDLLGQQAQAPQRGGGARGRGPAAPPLIVWAPMPVQPINWIPPNKPVTRLKDLLAKHKADQNWTEVVVNDNLFHAEYIMMAPGQRTPKKFYPENRAFWMVQDGQIRFTIDGQEPFVASKGFLVQVPRRDMFSMETVGDKPSLRVEVTMANSYDKAMYAADETPTPRPGVKYAKYRDDPQKGAYDDANVPFIDYNQTIAGHAVQKRNQNQWVGDPHGIANIIRGDPKTQPPANPANKGHYHLSGPEWWLIPEGSLEWTMETNKPGSKITFVADQGDIVYAPAQVWHAIRFAGTGMATRIAIVGYENSHVYQTPEELGGGGATNE
jgi:mannose-6-phosphate isomerase-like protein (cupin superfamily)